MLTRSEREAVERMRRGDYSRGDRLALVHIIDRLLAEQEQLPEPPPPEPNY